MGSSRRRCIGLDVHRDFAQVAIWQGGEVSQAGTFATTPEGVREFAAGLGPADEVALEATGNTWANRGAAPATSPNLPRPSPTRPAQALRLTFSSVVRRWTQCSAG
jgi:hypothetical protein